LEDSPKPNSVEFLDALAASLAQNGELSEATDREGEPISLMEGIDRRLNYERWSSQARPTR
jgi:hypothetical protein